MLSQALLLTAFMTSPFAIMGIVLWRANAAYRTSQR